MSASKFSGSCKILLHSALSTLLSLVFRDLRILFCNVVFVPSSLYKSE